MMSIFLYGAGGNGSKMLRILSTDDGSISIKGFIDASPEKKEISGIPIFSPDDFLIEYDEHETLIVITPDEEVALQIAQFLKENSIYRYCFGTFYKNTLAETIKEMRTKSTEQIYVDALSCEIKYIRKQLEQRMNQVHFLVKHINPNVILPATGKLRERQLKLIGLAKLLFNRTANLNISFILTFGNLLGYVRHKGFIPWDDDLDLMLTREDYKLFMDYAEKNLYCKRYTGPFESEPEREWYREMVSSCKKEIAVLKTPFITRVFAPKKEGEEALFIDLHIIDLLSEKLSIEHHQKVINTIRTERSRCPSCKEMYALVENEVEKQLNLYEGNDHCSLGLDCTEEYRYSKGPRLRASYDAMFPLIQTEYEELKVYIPNKPEEILRCLYGNDFYELSDDAALNTHNDFI